MNTSICPCGAKILWAVTVNGKAQPLDAETSEKGNIGIDESQNPPVARVIPKAQLEDLRLEFGENLRLYVAHHATCPKAAEFRKTPQGRAGGSTTDAGVFGDVPR